MTRPISIAIILVTAAACRGSSKPAPATADATARPPQPDATPAAPPDAGIRWTFDADPAGALPNGFESARTGKGAVGRWEVTRADDAPSAPNVLAQLDADTTDYRFPIALATSPSLRDLRLSVRCKPVSGKVDQACGLVFRYRDADNYYVTRANALEGNIRLYYVEKGQRKQIASHRGEVTRAWHDYAVEVRGDHIQVFWDGAKVIDHHDATFADAGRVGVWTKADSVTYFDDLAAEPLDAAP